MEGTGLEESWNLFDIDFYAFSLPSQFVHCSDSRLLTIGLYCCFELVNLRLRRLGEELVNGGTLGGIWLG